MEYGGVEYKEAVYGGTWYPGVEYAGTAYDGRWEWCVRTEAG